MKKKQNIFGLIGYGYWGPNFARTLNELADVELRYCADLIDDSLTRVKANYPAITTTKNYFELLNDSDIDGVFIVTPTKTHYKIAKDALEAGKHVFVEKPLTYSVQESEELVKLAKKNKVNLMVGHTFLYNSAVHYIKDLIDRGEVGELRHLEFQRRNLGPIRKDVNVLWDLAPHDISMMLYWIKAKPISASATGEVYLQEGRHDVVNATIKFENNIMVNILLSWIDPVKIRDVTIVGEKKMILFDDVHISEKIKIFDKNANVMKNTKDVGFGEYQIAIHSGDIHIPAIEMKEPLKEEIAHFIDCIRTNKSPRTDGKQGLNVVKILAALEKSLNNDSMVVHL